MLSMVNFVLLIILPFLGTFVDVSGLRKARPLPCVHPVVPLICRPALNTVRVGAVAVFHRCYRRLDCVDRANPVRLRSRLNNANRGTNDANQCAHTSSDHPVRLRSRTQTSARMNVAHDMRATGLPRGARLLVRSVGQRWHAVRCIARRIPHVCTPHGVRLHGGTCTLW